MDQDSVQCLESSLIEENLPPEIDTAGPAASATKYDFLFCSEFRIG